jgi:hypothetical protein
MNVELKFVYQIDYILKRNWEKILQKLVKELNEVLGIPNFQI